jgi:uncharacterized damage-inducible protein DinB
MEASMTAEDIRNLFEYNSWANHRAIESCAALSNEQFTRDLGSSFKSIRDTLAHIGGAEWLWLERFHGRSHSAIPAASDYADLAAVRTRWEDIERDLTDFIASLTDADLARVYEFKNTAGVAFSQPGWQMLQHLANHGSYHRGQIATMLRQLGAKGQSTDMIAFYRERAARATA